MIQKYPKVIATQATLHGDFTPYNFIISANGAMGVDIWATTEKPILFDLSRMLVYLSIAYPLLTLSKPVFDKTGKLNTTIAPLVKGYGQDHIDSLSLHFKVALLSEYLRRWLVIDKRCPTTISLLTDKYQILQIKRNIKTLITLIPKT